MKMGLDKIAGSFAIAAAVSDIFMLTKPETQNPLLRNLQRIGGRNGEPATWEIELSPEDNRWIWHGNGEEKREDQLKDKILGFLQAHAPVPFTRVEISKGISENENTVGSKLRELFSASKVLRCNKGRGYAYHLLRSSDLADLADLVADQVPDQHSNADTVSDTELADLADLNFCDQLNFDQLIEEPKLADLEIADDKNPDQLDQLNDPLPESKFKIGDRVIVVDPAALSYLNKGEVTSHWQNDHKIMPVVLVEDGREVPFLESALHLIATPKYKDGSEVQVGDKIRSIESPPRKGIVRGLEYHRRGSPKDYEWVWVMEIDYEVGQSSKTEMLWAWERDTETEAPSTAEEIFDKLQQGQRIRALKHEDHTILRRSVNSKEGPVYSKHRRNGGFYALVETKRGMEYFNLEAIEFLD